MSSLPIAPDESSGEPRCQRECPHRSKMYPTSTVFGPCAITQRPPRQHGDLCLPRVRDLVALAGRVSEALDVALCGGIDGAHHKAWVIDQMVRHLAGGGYAAWVAAARDGEDDSWDEGIAP